MTTDDADQHPPRDGELYEGVDTKRSIILLHPDNGPLLAYLKSRHPFLAEGDAVQASEAFPPPYKDMGIRPDVVEEFWGRTASGVPGECRLVIYRTPALVHPDTGVVFGFISGTPSYCLRLPPPERSEATAAGCRTVWTFNDAWMRNLGREHNTVLSLATIGPDWVFGRWLPEETRWCAAAFHYAGRAQGQEASDA